MEHAISVETLERITSLTEFLTYSENVDGDLVETFRSEWLGFLKHHSKQRLSTAAALGLAKGDVRPLARIGRGEAGYIARIIGNEEHRQMAIRIGLHPSASIRCVERKKDGSVEAVVAGETLTLEPAMAASILVWRQEAIAEPIAAEDVYRRTLADVTPGRSFRVVRVTATGEIRQRMTDMGFIRGAEGRILREALLRDPIEVQLNGSLLSLRRAEASSVFVEELDA